MQLPQLKRIRWAVRAALFLGVAASVAANVLHAQPNPISQTISAWPPLALLLTVELTSRIPMHRPILAFVRVLATVAIAGIAAWVSYWHMQGVALRFGETSMSAYLLPISVDGLIVVASVSLVELAGRIRMLEELALKSATEVAPAVPPVPFVQPAPVAAPASVPVFQAPPPAPSPAPVPVEALAVGGEAHRPAEAHRVAPEPRSSQERVATSPLSGRPLGNAPVSPAVAATPPAYVNGSRPSVARAAVSTPTRTVVTSPTKPAAESAGRRGGRPVQETVELADQIEAMHPNITADELADQLGISATRLKAVRREAAEVRRAAQRSGASK